MVCLLTLQHDPSWSAIKLKSTWEQIFRSSTRCEVILLDNFHQVDQLRQISSSWLPQTSAISAKDSNLGVCLQLLAREGLDVRAGMPDTYHFIPHKFQKTHRPEINIHPHIDWKKPRAEENLIYQSRICTDGDERSYESLLLHRVPSGSLHTEDMLAQWATGHAGQTSHNEVLGTCPRRKATASSIDPCESATGQSQERPPSLLPPIPRLMRLPSSDAARVECRLSSPSTPSDLRVSSDRTEYEDQVRCLSAQLQGICLAAEGPSPASRPFTPVPSLTTSHSTRSSSSNSDNLPHVSTTFYSQYRPTKLPQDCSSEVQASNIREHDPRRRNLNSPLPDSTAYHNIVPSSKAVPAHLQKTLAASPFQRTPNFMAKPMLPGLPLDSEAYQEVSYIDWDDDEDQRSDTALNRLKKSFTDLRAAERYIKDANIINKTRAARAVSGPESFTHTPRLSAGDSVYKSPTAHDCDRTATYSATIAKLRKKPSTKILASRRASDNNAAMTSPPTGKRKRANTVTSLGAGCSSEKKVTPEIVGGLVRRLVRVKEEPPSPYSVVTI